AWVEPGDGRARHRCRRIAEPLARASPVGVLPSPHMISRWPHRAATARGRHVSTQSTALTRDTAAPGQRYGGHSRSAPLRRVMVRLPAPPRTGNEWRELNYLHPVDHGKTLEEHAAFRAILEDAGIEVVAAGPDPDGMLDAIFADDSSIMTDHGVIVVRPGKVARQPEAALAEQSFTELGVPVLGRITSPGTVEGGDTCWLDEKTFAVGRGYRTNEEGIRQLTES